MGQSGGSRSPEIGRPRGAVWRMLVSEGIVWEGQVSIAGEHADLDARLIVTAERLVFVRNGEVALDAQRAWLDPAPVLGRDGAVTLSISTPNGNGPIPVDIRVRDGRFGAARLLTRLGDHPDAPETPPFSPSPAEARSGRRDRGGAPTDSGEASRRRGEPPARRGDRPSRPVASDRTNGQIDGPPVPSPAAFGISGPSVPAPAATPSFGVPNPRRSTPAPDPSVEASSAAGPRLSVESVSRAFGARPAQPVAPAVLPPTTPPPTTPTGGQPAGAPSVPPVPDDPSRWTLASALLARTTPPTATTVGRSDSSGVTLPTSSGTIPVLPSDSTLVSRPVVRQDTAPISRAGRPAVSGSTAPLALGTGSGAAASDWDPVSHARPKESATGRSMLPGLPASTPPESANQRGKQSAAPSGRIAGNSVITARSSAAARQVERQRSRTEPVRTDELIPSAVALASARAGVPLAPEPGPVPTGEAATPADATADRPRRRFLAQIDRSRLAWSVTAFALVILTVSAGLYLALGLPEDGNNGGPDTGQVATETGDGQAALVAGTPSASPTGTDRTPTATAAVPRGVGGETASDGIGDVIPTRAAVALPTEAVRSDPTVEATGTTTVPTTGAAPETATVDPVTEPAGTGSNGDGIIAVPSDDPVVAAGEPLSAEPSASTGGVESVAPSFEPSVAPSVEPSVAPSPDQTATVAPTATTPEEPSPEPTVAPTETAAAEPSPEPTVTEEPTVAPSPIVEPTVEPSAESTATTVPSPDPTATLEPTIEPQAATVPDDGIPSQVFVVGSVRYTVEAVSAGPTIPEINQPQSPFGGDWLAVVLYAENWGEGDAIIDMTQFAAYIASSGETRQLDSYSQVVSQRLGFPVVVGATEQVAVAPGDGIRLGLLYLTSQGASGFVLNAATTTIDLEAAFNSSLPMASLGAAPEAPELLEATVTGVIDAATIEVEVDGETIPVRYQGAVAPDIENCFSGQATTANRDLVIGQTVWLERQNANTAEDGAWLRDVWVESDSGSLELVSDVLISEGWLDADVTRPNSRYAAYLETTAVIAQSELVGQWAGCGD